MPCGSEIPERVPGIIKCRFVTSSPRSASDWKNETLWSIPCKNAPLITQGLIPKSTFPTFWDRKEKIRIMNLSKISRSALPSLALLLATSAFAANKANKGSLELSEPLTVSGHELKAGQYKLTWEGTSGDVQAMILMHGKLVAPVPARLTDINQPEPDNGVASRQNDDGSRSLTEVGQEVHISFRQ